MAVRFPAVRAPEKVTVKVVAVAAVTVPVTPLLNTTVLLPGVAESKPNPLMVNVAVEKKDLDEQIFLCPDSRVTFIRLTLLSGG